MSGYIAIIYVFLQFTAIKCFDYTWKEFNGEAPEDAFIAGLERNVPVYVGRAIVNDLLIPGKLYNNDEHLYYEMNGRALDTKGDVMILVAKRPETLQWIPTTSKSVDVVEKNQLVIGGIEPGYQVYIGRAFEDLSVNVGKVVCNQLKCLGLYTVKNGKVVKYHVYSVLNHSDA